MELGVTTLALGLRPRQGLARARDKMEAQERHLIPGSAGKFKRMNPYTPKATPNWGIRVLMDSQIFRERLQGSKPIMLKCSLYQWKAIET